MTWAEHKQNFNDDAVSVVEEKSSAIHKRHEKAAVKFWNENGKKFPESDEELFNLAMAVFSSDANFSNEKGSILRVPDEINGWQSLCSALYRECDTRFAKHDRQTHDEVMKCLNFHVWTASKNLEPDPVDAAINTASLPLAGDPAQMTSQMLKREKARLQRELAPSFNEVSHVDFKVSERFTVVAGHIKQVTENSSKSGKEAAIAHAAMACQPGLVKTDGDDEYKYDPMSLDENDHKNLLKHRFRQFVQFLDDNMDAVTAISAEEDLADLRALNTRLDSMSIDELAHAYQAARDLAEKIVQNQLEVAAGLSKDISVNLERYNESVKGINIRDSEAENTITEANKQLIKIKEFSDANANLAKNGDCFVLASQLVAFNSDSKNIPQAIVEMEADIESKKTDGYKKINARHDDNGGVVQSGLSAKTLKDRIDSRNTSSKESSASLVFWQGMTDFLSKMISRQESSPVYQPLEQKEITPPRTLRDHWERFWHPQPAPVVTEIKLEDMTDAKFNSTFKTIIDGNVRFSAAGNLDEDQINNAILMMQKLYNHIEETVSARSKNKLQQDAVNLETAIRFNLLTEQQQKNLELSHTPNCTNMEEKDIKQKFDRVALTLEARPEIRAGVKADFQVKAQDYRTKSIGSKISKSTKEFYQRISGNIKSLVEELEAKQDDRIRTFSKCSIVDKAGHEAKIFSPVSENKGEKLEFKPAESVKINQPLEDKNVRTVQYQQGANKQLDFYGLNSISGNSDAKKLKILELAVKSIEDSRAIMTEEEKKEPTFIRRGTAMPDEVLFALCAYCKLNKYEDPIIDDERREPVDNKELDDGVNLYMEALKNNAEEIGIRVGIYIGVAADVEQKIKDSPGEIENGREFFIKNEGKTKPMSEAELVAMENYNKNKSPFFPDGVYVVPPKKGSDTAREWSEGGPRNVIINGSSFNKLAPLNRNGKRFGDTDEVAETNLKEFFKTHLLGKMQENIDKDVVADYILNAGGFLYPVQEAVLKILPQLTPDFYVPAGWNPDECDLSYEATDTGFIVRDVTRIKNFSKNGNDILIPDEGQKYAYIASVAIKVDFSKDPAHPVMTVIEDSIQYGNKELETALRAITPEQAKGYLSDNAKPNVEAGAAVELFNINDVPGQQQQNGPGM